MSYVGNTPTTQSFIAGTDYFNGDGATVAFTLSRSVTSPNDIQATVNNVVQQPNTAYTVSGTTITFTSAPSAGTGNIYVRYLSTTTQSITPSQNTVSYSTLNSDTQSKLGISFKNRIINGSMLINQRAYNGTPAGSTYTLDRWAYQPSPASKFTISQSSSAPAGFSSSLLLTVASAYTPSGTDSINIGQYIEGYNIADLNWGSANAKTVTLSFWVNCSVTGTYSVQFGGDNGRGYIGTYTVNSANTWEQKSITVPGDQSGTYGTTNGTGITVFFALGAGSSRQNTAGTWIASGYTTTAATGSTNLVATAGATMYLTGIQLEVGTQATTFDYRSYGTELALCQRYFQTYVVPNVGGIPGNGVWRNSTRADVTQVLPVVMRSTPTIATTNISNINVYSGGSSSAASAFADNGSSTSAVSINITASGTAGAGVYLQASGASAGYTLSAEL